MTQQRCLCAVLMVTVLAAGAERTRAGVIKSPEQMTGPWQLFIDDHLVASRKNVVRRYHAFKKHPGNPLIVVDKPWEKWVVKVSRVLPEEDGSGFRMYYGCWSEPPEGAKKGWGSFACYATSKDGLKWEKPNLGLYEYKGSKDNNILPNSPAHVMFTPWEKDPAKRYQGVGGGGGYHAFSSPDGIHWKRESQEPIISGGDTSHFYWDPHTKLFRCTVKGGSNDRVGGDVGGLRRRCVGYSETTDLMKFPPLRMIMAPDDIDDLWCKQDTVQRTHFYACHILPYETIYIGLLQIYRAEEPEGYFHGPLWLELVSSRDGTQWNRAEADLAVRSPTTLQETSRPPLLNIGKYRDFDDGMVIAPMPVLVDDELWLYYTGYDEEHDLLPYYSAIGLAKLRKDGFVSLDADALTGEVVTTRFEGVGGVLQVNCEARGGSLRVEMLDAAGRVVPGYEADACEPLTGNGVRQAVSWRARKELPTGGAVRFRFVLDRARLYSFMPGEGARSMPEPAPAPLQALYTFEDQAEPWSDSLGADGSQELRNLGTCTIDRKDAQPAFGKHSLIVSSPWRPWNRAEIVGTQDLGRHFTLAAMVKSTKDGRARLFSAYSGNFPVKTSELMFEFDAGGRYLDGMRLVCKGIEVDSDPRKFNDGKYHHLAVVYDDGRVTFYLDGKPAGEQWIPGGEPVRLARPLLIGEDAVRGSDEQLHGHVDDVLVYGAALKASDIAAIAQNGAEAFFQSRR